MCTGEFRKCLHKNNKKCNNEHDYISLPWPACMPQSLHSSSSTSSNSDSSLSESTTAFLMDIMRVSMALAKTPAMPEAWVSLGSSASVLALLRNRVRAAWRSLALNGRPEPVSACWGVGLGAGFGVLLDLVGEGLGGGGSMGGGGGGAGTPPGEGGGGGGGTPPAAPVGEGVGGGGAGLGAGESVTDGSGGGGGTPPAGAAGGGAAPLLETVTEGNSFSGRGGALGVCIGMVSSYSTILFLSLILLFPLAGFLGSGGILVGGGGGVSSLGGRGGGACAEGRG